MTPQEQPKEEKFEKYLRCDHITSDCPDMCIHRGFHSIRQCHGVCPIERDRQQCSPDEYSRSHPHTPAPLSPEGVCHECEFDKKTCPVQEGAYCKDAWSCKSDHDATIRNAAIITTWNALIEGKAITNEKIITGRNIIESLRHQSTDSELEELGNQDIDPAIFEAYANACNKGAEEQYLKEYAATIRNATLDELYIYACDNPHGQGFASGVDEYRKIISTQSTEAPK
jgi:hypothetical protein